MKTLRQIISEVSQPKSGDEKDFKDKHVVTKVQHPVAPDHTFTGKLGKAPKRRADYNKGEDEAVYENSFKSPTAAGGEYDSEDSHQKYKKGNKSSKTMKEAKKMDPVGQEDDDIDNDVDTDKSDKYLHARRKAIGKAMSERVREPYAIGMAAAMKATGDKPPLKKSTITKAHKIAKSIEKNEQANLVAEDAMEEIPMMMRQLYYISYAAEEIMGYLEDMDIDPEEWFQNKLAGVHNEMMGMHAYMEGDKRMMSAMDYDDMYGEETNLGEVTRSAIKKTISYTGADGKSHTRNVPIRKVERDDDGEEKIRESAELTEVFSQGIVKLKDGGSVVLKKEDADLLNQMLKDLSSANRKKMEEVALKDKVGFNEILGFAREAL